MQLHVIRVPNQLKTSLENLANLSGRSISDITRDLTRIGIDLHRHGGIKITGPLGIERRFTQLNYGGPKNQRLSLRIGNALAKELIEEFNDHLGNALRDAIHLGLIRLYPNQVEIHGPFGVIRPLASINFPEPSNEIRTIIQRLQRM